MSDLLGRVRAAASSAASTTATRNHAITQAYEAGHSLRQIGEAAGVAPQTVANIVARQTEANR